MGDDDDGDYQAAFQQFMMGGNKPPSTPKVLSTPSTPTTDRSTPLPFGKSNRKSFRSILKAFQGTVERDVLQADDNLGGVVQSIFNLRNRIHWTSQAMSSKKEEASGSWKTQSKCHLTVQDLELALSYDLRQHEQMMSGARSLLASLNQAQESLGRRLDEAMRLELEDGGTASGDTIMLMEQVFHALSSALYQKQTSVLDVLESTNNQLLVDDDDDETSPRRTAEACWGKWLHTSQLEVVKEVMAL